MFGAIHLACQGTQVCGACSIFDRRTPENSDLESIVDVGNICEVFLQAICAAQISRKDSRRWYHHAQNPHHPQIVPVTERTSVILPPLFPFGDLTHLRRMFNVSSRLNPPLAAKTNTSALPPVIAWGQTLQHPNSTHPFPHPAHIARAAFAHHRPDVRVVLDFALNLLP